MKIRAQSQIPYLRDNLSHLASICVPRWHPLGFVSCVISKQDEEFITRVHYWPKFDRRTKNPQWPIHSHAYDLSSYILEGSVRDIQYQQTEGTDYTVYSVSYGGNDSAINISHKQISIKKVVDQVRNVGEEYSVAVGSLHQTKVSLGESAVSLVVTSNFSDVVPIVLGQPGEERYPYDRVEFDRFVFWKRIGGAIGAP